MDTFGSKASNQVIANLAARCVDSEEGASASGGGQDVGELGLEGAQPFIEHVAGRAHHAKELVPPDHLEHLLEQQQLAGVTHPRVKDAVRLVGGQVGLVEIAAHQHLLGEGHHVRRGGQVEVLVTPELAGGSTTCLHLVDQQSCAILVGDALQALEKVGRAGVVAALRLDGLHGNAGHVVATLPPLLEQILHHGQAAVVLLLVLALVLLQWVAVHWEAGNGPVEGGHVQLMDSLGVCGGEDSHGATVKGALEGEDGEGRGAGRLIDHARLHLLLAEGHVLSALLLPVAYEHVLVGVLVGARSAHHGGELRQAFGRHLAEDGVEPLGPVLTREHAQRRPVHQRLHIVRVVHDPEQIGVVVTQRHRGDLRVDVEEDIAVRVHQVVAQRALVVREKLHGARLLESGELIEKLLRSWSRDVCLDRRPLRLPGEHVKSAAAS